jgi:glycosyltransferase involved in cell wall biosynthesis
MALGYRLASARVGVSNGVVDDIAQLSGLSPDRFSVIHNPVRLRDTPSFESLADAEALWGVPRGARLISVGKFKAQKNHPLLLRAFARLSRPDARLMLVGSGDGEPALRQLAAELGVAERVIFAGFKADPTPFYATSDLFVLASDYEGFGNVIVEALRCGVPVVATDCRSGPREILDDGKYGRLVPVGDADALAEAMFESLDGIHDPAVLKARAGCFSVAKAADDYLGLLLPDSVHGWRCP